MINMPGGRVRKTTTLLIVLGMLLLSACASMKGPRAERRDKAFTAALETHRKLVRWGYFEEAAQYLKGKDSALPPPDFNAYRGFKVTGYDIGEQINSDDGNEVRVIAQVEFYEVDSHVAGSVRDTQLWWYDEDAERWYLGSPLPAFTVGPQVRVIQR